MASSPDGTVPPGPLAGDGPLKRPISRTMLLIRVGGGVLRGGIYALVVEAVGRGGGAIWTACLLALALAILSAFAYEKLVTKYPQASGAALYVNKAWPKPFVTCLVDVAVM